MIDEESLIPVYTDSDGIGKATLEKFTEAIKLSEVVTTEQNARIEKDNNLESRLSSVEEKIPSTASSENVLTTKSYVDDSISTNTAIFRGSFETKANLDLYEGEKTVNDYVVVQSDETHSEECWRYKYDGTSWSAEYRINETALTESQTNALNSEITKELTDVLKTVEQGSQKNVQPDWNELNEESDSFIKNKPTGISVVDVVESGNQNAVSSNAVSQALSNLMSFDEETGVLTINV